MNVTKRLSGDDLLQLAGEGNLSLVFQIGPEFYMKDDLHQCVGCPVLSPDPADLIDGHCEDCVEEIHAVSRRDGLDVMDFRAAAI